MYDQAGKHAGLSDTQISHGLEDMHSSKVKDRLKQFTDEALNHGVSFKDSCASICLE
ncbi:hypothetical protein DPMN_157643 [Dreissena polymorpha]|uniref:Uncharacterized protein n=1 Tax=Dreissena polymorpha TaxID=45954 RepID=A0A9D4EKQ9_DREPO|nr:hypothetical protein DPMN_157643 [Dreissena polymorpha]